MRLSILFLLFVVCAFGASEAQRVYYQAGFPLAPARRLSLVNRQRVRLANGFSARLQQSTDETEDSPSNNLGGGIGTVTNNSEGETNENNVEDEVVDDTSNSQSPAPGSTKTMNSNEETTDRSNDVADSGDAGEAENNSEEVTNNDSKTDDKTSSTTESSVDDTSAEDVTGNDENVTSPSDEKDNSLNSVENKKKHDSSGGSHDDDSHNHGDSIEWLKDAIQGEPGVDYPIYSEIPATSFKCSEQKLPGYYGDVEAKCQVFHICQADGRMDSFLCPNGTIFAQNYFVCVWWHDFDCSTTESYYNLNENLYKKGKGIDGSDILSPMDMINEVMNSIEKTGSDDEMKSNTIDGENETGEDADNTEGDKFSKTNGNMGSINKKGLNNKINTFNDFKPTNNNGLNNFNGKTNMSPGTVAGSSPSGKTNFNKGEGETKTTEIVPKKNIPNNQPLEPEDQSNNDDSDDGTNDNEMNKAEEVETSSIKTDDFNTSTELPEKGDGENTKTNEDENTGKTDSQQNVDENDMPVDKKNNDESTSTIASDNFITENPAAEEVTDTPTESSVEEDGKDVPAPKEKTQPEDVQVYENEETNSLGSARSRARFLLYRPRFKSVPLARVRVSTAARRPRFLPVISARNGVSRRFVAPKSLNKKKSKAIRLNKKRSNVRRVKSPKKLKNRSGRQIISNKKKSNHNSPKKSNSHKKKNLKRANNRRKQIRSNGRRRNNVRRSRSNRRSNRRLIVSGSTLSLRKQH